METNTATQNQATWAIDPMHSEVQFKVRHLVISTVSGSFKLFGGQVTNANDAFTQGQVEFDADLTSIDTGNEQRDQHLRSADFFDADVHPKLHFRGSLSSNGGKHKLYGDMTIKGNTHPVEFEVEHGGNSKDLYGNFKAGFEVSGKINRSDFGLTWNALTETGGMVVSDEVKLTANIQLAKQQ